MVRANQFRSVPQAIGRHMQKYACSTASFSCAPQGVRLVQKPLERPRHWQEQYPKQGTNSLLFLPNTLVDNTTGIAPAQRCPFAAMQRPLVMVCSHHKQHLNFWFHTFQDVQQV